MKDIKVFLWGVVAIWSYSLVIIILHGRML